MEAIIKTGGQQFSVKKGTKLNVHKLDGDKDAQHTFEPLCITTEGQVKVGQPVVKGAKVIAKVLKQFRGEKVVARTYKRRKGFHKKIGHRQDLTQIEIVSIEA